MNLGTIALCNMLKFAKDHRLLVGLNIPTTNTAAPGGFYKAFFEQTAGHEPVGGAQRP